jgi:membrane protease YdiL (CAAX protease family)
LDITEELPESAAPEESRGQPAWTQQLLELGVFLLFILPPTAISFYMYFFHTRGGRGLGNFRFYAISCMCGDLALVALIFFFLWRNGEPFRSMGWNFQNSRRDIRLGCLVSVGISLPIILLVFLEKKAGHPVHLKNLALLAAQVEAQGALFWALLFVIITALSEEIIYRGYLILRLKAITASPGWAVIISAVIFGMGHAWKGAARAIGSGLVGVFFGLVYLRRRSLVAPITMHFLADIGIVLIPLFGIKAIY